MFLVSNQGLLENPPFIDDVAPQLMGVVVQLAMFDHWAEANPRSKDGWDLVLPSALQEVRKWLVNMLGKRWCCAKKCFSMSMLGMIARGFGKK